MKSKLGDPIGDAIVIRGLILHKCNSWETKLKCN